ncbi:MAG: hypothetical protein IIB61_04830 [Planctomycetes bacterium]|nr:hypothetical protein [Planctomycetota bacterium]
MAKRLKRLMAGGCLAGVCMMQGCGVDTDILLRAGLSFGSDAAIFLLENLVASL